MRGSDPRAVFGIESEYALGLGLDRPLDRSSLFALSRRLPGIVQSRLPCLQRPGSSGVFLSNGMLFYIDCGDHPEMATPECTHPSEVVRYALAGDRILVDAASALVDRFPRIAETRVYRVNVDYSGSRSTWGCHESYLHSRDVRKLGWQLIPHLVSRIVLVGAGGFDNTSAGLRFCLSPRARHIERVFSHDSTARRPLIHLKDEPLAGGAHRRLHLVCGERLCSQKAAWLKVGCTALVIAMVEGGMKPARGLRLRRVTEALRTFTFDPDLNAVVALHGGKHVTALALQRRLLEQAEGSVGRRFMPPWAEDVCGLWREALDALEKDPSCLDATLDWRLKKRLFDREISQRGFSAAEVREWTLLMESLEGLGIDLRHLEDTEPEEHALQVAKQVKRTESLWRRGAITVDPCEQRVLEFLNLRQTLFEMDTRFGQVGSGGLFERLDRARLLHHAVVSEEDVLRALETPPAGSRARLRGDCIRRLAGQPERYACQWDGIVDTAEETRLDLSDPFAATERWQRDVYCTRNTVILASRVLSERHSLRHFLLHDDEIDSPLES